VQNLCVAKTTTKTTLHPDNWGKIIVSNKKLVNLDTKFALMRQAGDAIKSKPEGVEPVI